MTRKSALSLLNIATRQLDNLLSAEGIPAGSRSRAGTLTPQATAAVQRLYLQRKQKEASARKNVQVTEIGSYSRLSNNSPEIHQSFTAPVSEAEPAPWRAYEHLRAEVIALQADAERLQGVAEDAYRVLCELDGRLNALERRPAPRASWRALWARLFPARPAVAERWPATEVYSGSVLRRA